MENVFLFLIGFVLGFLISDKITQWYKKRLDEAKKQLDDNIEIISKI